MDSFPDECRVGVKVAAQVAGEEPRLEMRDETPSDLFLKKGMDQFLAFPFLPGNEHFLAGVFAETTAPFSRDQNPSHRVGGD